MQDKRPWALVYADKRRVQRQKNGVKQDSPHPQNSLLHVGQEDAENPGEITSDFTG